MLLGERNGMLVGFSSTPLAGLTFSFATTQGFMEGIKACIEALGGTVEDMPEPAEEE